MDRRIQVWIGMGSAVCNHETDPDFFLSILVRDHCGKPIACKANKLGEAFIFMAEGMANRQSFLMAKELGIED